MKYSKPIDPTDENPLETDCPYFAAKFWRYFFLCVMAGYLLCFGLVAALFALGVFIIKIINL